MKYMREEGQDSLAKKSYASQDPSLVELKWQKNYRHIQMALSEKQT